MNGTLALARAEIRRLGRNKRYSVFSVALPVVLYSWSPRRPGTRPHTESATPRTT